MIYILNDRLIHIEWSIFKGTSQVHEDFSHALVKVFLIGPNEKYLLQATAEGGKLLADVPQGLPEGAYSIEAIYVKNYGNLLPAMGTLTPSTAPGCHRFPLHPVCDHHFIHPHDHRSNDRCLMRSRMDYVFALTSLPTEEEGVPSSGEITLRFKSSVASYGYDGLSAYEIAVMRGDFNGSEGEWLENMSPEKIEVDDSLSETSKNPVENRVTTNELKKKQPLLVSGKNIKTINGKSILGEGNIVIEGGDTSITVEDDFGESTENPGSQRLITEVNKSLDNVSKSVNAIADDEDLILVERGEQGEHTIKKLKFADKAYNASAFSGMGRVYLRKNIIGGNNVLTQSMIGNANTRYIIQYDYDLNGKTINVPEGCTLDFQGGSFKNGTIRGYHTIIESPQRTIFQHNTVLSGTWNIDYAYPEWFGAKGDGATDDALPICLCFKYFENTKLGAKTYYIKSIYDEVNNASLVLPERHNVYGSSVNHNLTDSDVSTLKVDTITPSIILRVVSASILERITIVGNSKDKSLQQAGIANTSNYFNHGTLNRVNVRNCYYGFNLQLWSVMFTQCYTAYCGIGFYLHGKLLNDTSVSVEGTTITMIGCLGVDSLYTGIKMVGITYSSLINCGFDGCGWGGYDTPIPFNRTSYSYAFYQCRDINVISCGAEQATKAILTSNCQDISFLGLNLLIKKTELEDDYDYSKTILISWSVRIFFQGIRINLTGKYIFVEHDSNNTGIKCIFNEQLLKENITAYGISMNTILFNNYSPIYGDYSTRKMMKKNTGQQFYDTSLGTYIYFDGSYWKYLSSDKYLKESVLYTENNGISNANGDNWMYSHDLDASELGFNEGDILFTEWIGEKPSNTIYQLLIAYNGQTYVKEATIMEVPANVTTIRIQFLFSKKPETISFSICRMLPQ